MENVNQEYVNSVLDPKVLEVVDRYSLTSLQALIVHYLTDPKVEYTTNSIVKICQNTLHQGSRRHVRRIRNEMKSIVDNVHLAREMNLLGEADEFTTKGMTVIDPPALPVTHMAPKNPVPAVKKQKGNGGIKEDDDGYWDVTEELDCVKSCGKAPENGYIFISSIAWKKIKLYMNWAGSQEWLAYLVGTFVKDDTVEVTDIMLPTQNASQTLVHNVNVDEYKGIVGVIHSHHEMGGAKGDVAGFSGHDEAFINSNHNVSLLVAKDGIAGHIRVKTPCGAFLRITAKVKQMDEVDLDEKKLKEEFKSKIQFGGGRGGSGGKGSNRYFSENWNDGRGKVPYHFG